MSDLENELKRQPLRRVPEHWRKQILDAAQTEAAPGHSSPRAWSWWDLLWPSPKAWGTLAAAWVILIACNLAIREESPSGERAETAQIRMAMEQKKHLQAEIEEASLHAQNESPKPRSEATGSGKSA